MNEKQMREMAVSILLDEYTQLDVAQLLKEYEEEEENGDLPNMPDALDERCAKLIRREIVKKKQKKNIVRISKTLSHAAVAVLALIGFCSVSVLAVEAWREPVLQFVLETFDRRSSVSMEGNISQEINSPETVVEKLSEIIPSGYSCAYKNVQNERYHVKYTGNGGEIINLIASAYLYEKYYDTESAEGEHRSINGYEVVFINKNGYKVICLNEDRELLIELRTVGVSEKLFWDIVNEITK